MHDNNFASSKSLELEKDNDYLLNDSSIDLDVYSTYLLADPKLQRLMDQINVPSTPKTKVLKSLDWLFALFYTNPKEMLGTAIVLIETEQDAKITARVATVAAWLDTICNWPVYYFILGASGLFSGILSVFMTFFILNLSNNIATVAVRRKSGAISWSMVTFLIGYIPLSLLRTSVSAVGVEILNNRPAINQLLAEDLVSVVMEAKEVALPKGPSISHPSYLDIKTACTKGKQFLEKELRSNPLWEATYLRIYGTVASQSSIDNLPFDKKPKCHQQLELESSAANEYNSIVEPFNQLKAERDELQNDVFFYQTHFPIPAATHFSKEGEILSGIQTVTYGIKSIKSKVSSGRWVELNLTLFMFILSFVSSAVAGFMLLSFSMRQDVAWSWDPDIKLAKLDFFSKLHYKLLKKFNQEN